MLEQDNLDLKYFINKAKNDDKLKKPSWIRVKAPISKDYNKTRELIKTHNLHTVCEEAACPNIGECWEKKHATVMILGDTCTRSCRFCNIKTGKPMPIDSDEPKRLAVALGKLGLTHVVITSVDRDDLEDGGAIQFVNSINEIRKASPDTTIEILTPDFLRKPESAPLSIIKARPDVFNHNIETVPSLYNKIRPGARYFNSLNLLSMVKKHDPEIFTKSGLMVGLGETKEEVLQVMDDLRAAKVDFLTIGQYLQPTPNHAKVEKFVTPEEFEYLERAAKAKGFLMVSASPLTRSSYHASEDFEQLRLNRQKMLINA